MKTIRLKDGGNEIEILIDLENGGGKLTSNLKSDDQEDADYNNVIDGFECLLLSLACSGVDLLQEATQEAIWSAIYTIANNLL